MKKLIIILSLIFSSVTYADHKQDFSNFFFQQVPALCGTPKDIETYVRHLKFKPYHLSLGRERMKVTGQPVYMVTYYVNEDGTESAAVITVPSGSESCLIYRTFDLTKRFED